MSSLVSFALLRWSDAYQYSTPPSLSSNVNATGCVLRVVGPTTDDVVSTPWADADASEGDRIIEQWRPVGSARFVNSVAEMTLAVELPGVHGGGDDEHVPWCLQLECDKHRIAASTNVDDASWEQHYRAVGSPVLCQWKRALGQHRIWDAGVFAVEAVSVSTPTMTATELAEEAPLTNFGIIVACLLIFSIGLNYQFNLYPAALSPASWHHRGVSSVPIRPRAVVADNCSGAAFASNVAVVQGKLARTFPEERQIPQIDCSPRLVDDDLMNENMINDPSHPAWSQLFDRIYAS